MLVCIFFPSFFLNWNSKYINDPCSSLHHHGALFVAEFISDIRFFFPLVASWWLEIGACDATHAVKRILQTRLSSCLNILNLSGYSYFFFLSFRIMSEGDL